MTAGDEGAFTSEGDSNLSAERQSWAADHIDDGTRAMLAEDERYFFRQSLSTPCLNVLSSSSGAHLTDMQGRRILDFHGNSVHQVGYGHPRVVAAVKAAVDELPFSPRRYTNRFAIGLARRLSELAPMENAKVLFAPSGAAAISMALKLARYATGRHKTVSMWDAFHGANLDAIAVGGEALFRADVGPLMPGTEHVPPPGLAPRFFGNDGRAHERLADYIDYVLQVQGDVAAVLAEPMRWTTVELAAPGVLGTGTSLLRQAWSAVDLRRDPERTGPHRHHVHERADRRRARHPGDRQGAGRRHHADGRHDRPRRSRRRGQCGAGTLYP